LVQLSVKGPVGYVPATLQQIIQADNFFWSKLAEKVGIEVSPGVVDPNHSREEEWSRVLFPFTSLC
jgi:hypothetical protein